MRALQLKPEEQATLDRLTGEIRTTAVETGADPQALQERVAADYRLVDGYLAAIYQEMAKIGLAPACRAGCDYCCYMTVYVAEAEAFYLARHIEQSAQAEALKQSVIETAKVLRGMRDEDRLKKPVACPLLDRREGKCMVYEARSFVCRTHHNLSRLACKRVFRGATDNGMSRAFRAVLMLGAVVRQGYARGLAESGLASQGIEMVAALAAIFSTENAYERWAGGEDIFAGARNAVPA